VPPGRATADALPALHLLVEAADAGLHKWVHEHIPVAVRRAALEQEIGYWLNTAARDLHRAKEFAEVAPRIGQPPEAYLDRWLSLVSGGHVLAGPRYLGLDPTIPFVGVSASDRLLQPHDCPSLATMAQHEFAPFAPGFVMIWSSDPVGSWPHTGSEMRQVVGRLGDLRRRNPPGELSSRARRDTAFYSRYQQIHAEHIAEDPAHARHTRVEEQAELAKLASRGFVYDVLVDGNWAGLLAAERDARRGVRGATVVELLLDHRFRGRGYGRHLSTVLAMALPLPDDECLMGTIHADNTAAYRAALGAGRVDVGGEIRVPV